MPVIQQQLDELRPIDLDSTVPFEIEKAPCKGCVSA